MDSGATESGAPPSMAPCMGEDGGGRRVRPIYVRVEIVVQKRLQATTSGVADVTEPCVRFPAFATGYTITFQAEGRVIENPAGVQTHFGRDNDVYVKGLHGKEPLVQPGFSRQTLGRQISI